MVAHSSWVAETRGKLTIVIFGPYRPPEAKERLRALRDFMRSKGYIRTSIVEDLSEPPRETGESNDAYFLRKSEYWVGECDVGIEVLLCGADNLGVGQELRHLLDNIQDRVWRHNLFLEKKCSFSSLLKGMSERWSDVLTQYYFTSNSDLHEAAYGRMADYIGKLYYRLRERGI